MAITTSTNQNCSYGNNKRKRDSNCGDEKSAKVPRREEQLTDISRKIIHHANKLTNGIDSTIGISFADVLTSLNPPIKTKVSQSRSASASLEATKNQNETMKDNGSAPKDISRVEKPKENKQMDMDIPARKAYLFDETISWSTKRLDAELTKSTNRDCSYKNNDRKTDSNCDHEKSRKIPRREEQLTNISRKIIHHANKLTNGIDSTIGISFADVLTSLNPPIKTKTSQSRSAPASLQASKNQNEAMKDNGSTFKAIPRVDEHKSEISCSLLPSTKESETKNEVLHRKETSNITNKSKGDKQRGIDVPASKVYLFDETIPWHSKKSDAKPTKENINSKTQTTTTKSGLKKNKDGIAISDSKVYLSDENIPGPNKKLDSKDIVHPKLQTTTKKPGQERNNDEIVIPASKAYLSDENISWSTKQFDVKSSEDRVHSKIQTATKQSYRQKGKDEILFPASKDYLFDDGMSGPIKKFDAKPSKDTAHPNTQPPTKQFYQGRKKNEIAILDSKADENLYCPTTKSEIKKAKNAINKKNRLGKENVKPKNKHKNQAAKEETLKVITHANKLKNGIDCILGISFADVLESLAQPAKKCTKTISSKKCK